VSSLRVLRTFAIVGAAAFVLSALAVAVAAADDDGVPDDMEARTARNVVAHGAVDSFFIRSKSVGATQDDVFEVDYSDGRFTVSYARTAGEADTVWYRLEFKRIAEVRGDGGQIEVVQKIAGPQAVIKGTRVPVSVIVGYLGIGETPESLTERILPRLSLAQVYDALSYYHDHRDEIEQEMRENTEEYGRAYLREHLGEEGYRRVTGQAE